MLQEDVVTAPVAHAMWHMGRRLGPQVGPAGLVDKERCCIAAHYSSTA